MVSVCTVTMVSSDAEQLGCSCCKDEISLSCLDCRMKLGPKIKGLTKKNLSWLWKEVKPQGEIREGGSKRIGNLLGSQ